MRYHRQTILPGVGAEGQKKLASSAVLIVGLGGLGAPVATYLTGAGVGRIGLCDPDVVSLTNLQRQVLYTEDQVGVSKVHCAAKRLASQSSHTRFELFYNGLTAENAANIIKDYDLIIDCTDNYATRYLLDDVCLAAGRPWIHAAIGEFNGQLTVFNGPVRKLRYADLYPDREQLSNAPRQLQGVLGAVPGVIGSLQASEALKFLLGIGQTLDGRLLVIDLLNNQFQTFEL